MHVSLTIELIPKYNILKSVLFAVDFAYSYWELSFYSLDFDPSYREFCGVETQAGGGGGGKEIPAPPPPLIKSCKLQPSLCKDYIERTQHELKIATVTLELWMSHDCITSTMNRV